MIATKVLSLNERDAARRVLALLNRHCAGLTKCELNSHRGLELEQIATCLEHLREARTVSSQAYARGELYRLSDGVKPSVVKAPPAR